MNFVIKTISAMILFAGLSACGNGVDPELEAATEGREANLSFHMVHEGSDDPKTMMIAQQQGLTPPGTVLMPYPEFNTELLIIERSRIDQDCLKSIKVGLHPESNRPILNFKFDQQCSEYFGRLTAENIGRRFAVVVNGVIVTAPNIRSAIHGGAGFIEGGFDNMKEAKELEYILNRQRRQKSKP